MLHIRLCLFATLVVNAYLAQPVFADDSSTARSIIVEEYRNDSPSFMVRVDVDQGDHLYREGETMTVKVRSEKTGFLYLFYSSADEEMLVLFPNKHQSENKILANQETTVPLPESGFRLRVAAPFGTEVLKAVVTTKRLKALEALSLTESVATSVDQSQARSIQVEGCRPDTDTWAEHCITINTVPKDATVKESVRRRFGIYVGISQFSDPKIRPLRTSHTDAEVLAQTMRQHCQMNQTFLLQNEQATLENIESVVREKLVKLTSPGDEVFFFWSGHGARIADDNDDEEDGLDELLVTYDTDTTDIDRIRETSLLDDKFGRWVQELDGRRVVIVLDTCHSGGQATNEKGLKQHGKGLNLGATKSLASVDFIDGELNRAKDIGQRESAVLASSRANQISFERLDGDLSAMTRCLVDLLESSQGKLTLAKAFEHLESKVPEYVESTFPGTTQTPVLINDTTPPLYLKP